MFNWDEFKNEKVAVWCDTEEKAREFIEECYKRDMKWGLGDKEDNFYCNYDKETCYTYGFHGYNGLQFADKSFYEGENYKIISWEGENMKFKVGDKVVMSDGGKWLNGDKYRTIIECCVWDGKNRYELSNSNLYWYDGEIKLYKPQTEFTSTEVIARDENNKTYECTETGYNLQTIKKLDNGNIRLYFKNHDDDYSSNLEYITVNMKDAKFKLQEPKKRITIYKVEHKQDGKKYDFISSQRLQEEIFVVCDTTQGKSYGRVVGSEDIDLTEEEIKQYKECWRA